MAPGQQLQEQQQLIIRTSSVASDETVSKPMNTHHPKDRKGWTAVNYHIDDERISPDEARIIFGNEAKDGVPEHEIVPITQIIRADTRVVHLTSFAQKMTLYLEPSGSYLAGVETPVFKASSDTNHQSGVDFEILPNAIKSTRKFYQDLDNLAALVIEDEPDGRVVMRGVVDNFGIQPLPSRLRAKYKRSKRETRNDTDHYVVFKIKPADYYNKEDPVTLASQSVGPDRKLTKPRSRNNVPDDIHLQVLVILDSELCKVFNNEVGSIVDYTLSYWNGVDLRYRVFNKPNIHVNIAGIVLADTPEATPYINDNLVQIGSSLRVRNAKSLRIKSSFLYAETSHYESKNSMSMSRLGVEYDMAVTLTARDVCTFDKYCDQRCYDDSRAVASACDSLGFAYYTGACAYELEGKPEMESVAIIEDTGAFSGIIPTAHEIGHLMGASHNSGNANKCPVNDGYLMSQRLLVTRDSFVWSNCSAYSVYKFLLEEQRAKCLFNEPNAHKFGLKVPSVKLPGKLYSRDDQCRILMGTESCDSASCDKLYCNFKKLCVNAPNVAVPEGAVCARGHHCINGECTRFDAESVIIELGGTTTKRPAVYEKIWSKLKSNLGL